MKPIFFIERESKKVKKETPPGEWFLQFLYYSPLGKLPLYLIVKRKFLTIIYGHFMKSKLSKRIILKFIENYNINTEELEKNTHEFNSFNDFFCRKLKSHSREIQQGLVSPADGKVLAYPTIEELHNFYIKGLPFNLSNFLKNEQLAEKFKESIFIIIRLATDDYHRFHFPYTGIPSKSTNIKGYYYSVSRYAVIPNLTKIFCENKRKYTILSTKGLDDILICPIGATMVGSISDTYIPNSPIKKGDEMGYFSFGGSTIVLLVNKKKLMIADDILTNTQQGLETSIKMGEQIGNLITK
ncbi:phosphatidylserine decarboxylase [Flavobacteriaceae bacterium UJ101]|nr:phosphatidylserine decarboxylase [Flavobacteriaceae bacterium UJ101]